MQALKHFDGPYHITANVLRHVLPELHCIQIPAAGSLDKRQGPNLFSQVDGSSPQNLIAQAIGGSH